MQISVDLPADSWLLATLIIMSATTIPVKIGADIFGALHNELRYCAISVTLATITAILVFKNINSQWDGLIAFVAVSVIYWRILKLPFLWSFIFTLAVVVLQLSAVKAMSVLGFGFVEFN